MAYAAEHLSLAALEVFVHLAPRQRPHDLVSILGEIPVDPAIVEREKQRIAVSLSATWQDNHPESRSIGDTWCASRISLLLPVPSAIIDGEWNALINPAHPDAARVRVIEVKPFAFDARTFKDVI